MPPMTDSASTKRMVALERAEQDGSPERKLECCGGRRNYLS